MGSTFYEYFYPRYMARQKAREPRYQRYKRAMTRQSVDQAGQRIEQHTKRLETLVEHIPQSERDQVNAELAALEIERKHAEHLNNYAQMTAEYQDAIRMQYKQARAQLQAAYGY